MRAEGTTRLELVVPSDAAGERLDRFLAAPLGSRARAQTLIDASRVRVDGRVRPKRHTVRAGERIVVEESEEAAAEVQAADVPFGVAFEDEHLLIVDKPAGVVVHPARGHWTGTLAQALAGRGAGGGEEPWRAGIVHRLDRDTSGLLVVAKNDEIHRELKGLLAARKLHREYLALVDGRPPARTGTVEAPIGRHRRDRVLMSIDSDDTRDARTHFEVERLLPHDTLLRVALDTGRTHQIRVHMAAIGHPVVGDRQYGGVARYGLERQFLHAARLAFEHPVTGAAVDVSSPLPDDLAVALSLAAAAASDGPVGR
jgi:23S rRNA pseudouridine1911/1915/1917 synthase